MLRKVVSDNTKYIITAPGDIIITIIVIMIVIMTIIFIYTITIIIFAVNLSSIYGFSFLGRKCLMVYMCFILRFSSVRISACSFLVFYQVCHSATAVVPYP